jgi:integrase/recombinase XerD
MRHRPGDVMPECGRSRPALERGMPIEQIQKFPGHAKLEATRIYAKSSAEMIKDSYQKALGG